MSKILSLVFLFTIVTTQAFAFPLPTPEQAQLALKNQRLSIADFNASYDFEGIVKLSNCSGSLVRYETSSDTDLALILTNGHCLDLGGFLKPGEVIYNRPISRKFGLYNAQAQIVGNLQATHIVYGTMTATDMALYRLNETYAEIKSKYNVNALVMDSYKADVNTEIQVISGYWKRGYSCGIERFVYQLEEAGWLFTDSIRYSRPGCETIGGTSGSPIINPITRKVIGVNNTGNDSGGHCTMNNPCEVDEQGNKKAYEGVSYGQQTYWVYSCLTANNEINLLKEGCLLPK